MNKLRVEGILIFNSNSALYAFLRQFLLSALYVFEFFSNMHCNIIKTFMNCTI